MQNIILKTIKYASALILFLAVFGMAKVSANAGEINMHVINIGHGDAILFESQNHYMLVDSGEAKASDTLMNYLAKFNIPNDTIDYVVATHADQDHVGGFKSVFAKYKVKRAVYSEPMKDSKSYNTFVEGMTNQSDIDFRNAKEGLDWTLGDATVTILYDGRKGTTYNESSIVFRVTCDKKSILMTGDLPTTMEDKLMAHKYNLKADILKVAHHGAAASTSNEFIEYVNPTHAVIPNGTVDGVFLPKDSVLQRLASHFVKTYLATEGDIVMNIKNNVISTTHKENKKFECISRGQIVLNKKIFTAPQTVGKAIVPKFHVYANGELIDSSQYTVKFIGNTHTGFATVTVTGNKKKYVGSIETTFMILPRKTKVLSTKRSLNRKKITLTWSKQTYCSGYTIKYSTDRKMKKDVKIITIKGGTHNKKTIKKLNKYKKYYFKIRAYTDYIGKGKWCTKKSVR